MAKLVERFDDAVDTEHTDRSVPNVKVNVRSLDLCQPSEKARLKYRLLMVVYDCCTTSLSGVH